MLGHLMQRGEETESPGAAETGGEERGLPRWCRRRSVFVMARPSRSSDADAASANAAADVPAQNAIGPHMLGAGPCAALQQCDELCSPQFSRTI